VSATEVLRHDVDRLLMITEAVVSLIIGLLVIARAINILT